MGAIEPNILGLLIFASAWGVCCAGAIHIAGVLPLKVAPDEARSNGGAILIIINTLFLCALTAFTLYYGHRELKWTSAVIFGGIIFLSAPFATQDLPERFKYGKAGLTVLLATLLATSGVLLAEEFSDVL